LAGVSVPIATAPIEQTAKMIFVVVCMLRDLDLRLQQGFATSGMGFERSICAAKIVTRACPLWVKSRHWFGGFVSWGHISET
jgi:hypothetical protein